MYTKEVKDLKGTVYFELLPGDYKNKYWNEGSFFIDESTFLLIEFLIVKHSPKFDHNAFTVISRNSWNDIIADMNKLSGIIRKPDDIKEFYKYITDNYNAGNCFNKDPGFDKKYVKAFLADLSHWLKQKLTEVNKITILGL